MILVTLCCTTCFGLKIFNKPTSEPGLLNRSSCLARTLGVAKFIVVTYMILVIFCCATCVLSDRHTMLQRSNSPCVFYVRNLQMFIISQSVCLRSPSECRNFLFPKIGIISNFEINYIKCILMICPVLSFLQCSKIHFCTTKPNIFF